MERERDQNQDSRYISLFEAAKLCSYSEPYLRLRSRQGKLKSIKLGKKWMTSRQWLADYEARVCRWRAENENRRVKEESNRITTIGVVPDNFSADTPADHTDDIIPSAVLCSKSAHLSPPVAPKRRLPAQFGGQIIPPPKESKSEDNLNHGAVAAIIGGSLAAFLLFFAVQPRSFLNAVQLRGMAIGQANISQPAKISDRADVFTPEKFQTKIISPLPATEKSALEILVSRIAEFFDFSVF